MKCRYWLVRKAVCLVAYYGGLRTNELRSIEFGKTFSGGERGFEVDDQGYWFCFERSKQRGATETTTILVPRRQSDWVPIAGDAFRCPTDYDPASIIDEYLEVLEADLNLTRDELFGPFFRSTHGVGGLTFLKTPLGINYLGKIGVEFAMQLMLPNSGGFTGHCWRRSCGTNASNAGINVTTLMAQLGWSTPKTALGYVKKSRITSLTLSTFLSNVQRQNKVLDAGGVRSTPKGVQLLKSGNGSRSAKKKLDTELGSPDIGENEEDFLSSPLSSSLSVTVTDSVKASVPVSAPPAAPVAAPLAAHVVAPPAARVDAPSSVLVQGESSEVSLALADPRVSAILQNFQNNGNVQIHFHFKGNS